jgi:tRNA pseudouridine55 synthase
MSNPTGVLIIDKPTGCTSHDVVGRVRKALGTRKVGHAGTLDPAASGVLIVGVGRATRLLGYLTKADKRYAATVRLGVSTTTDDAEGEVTATSSCAGIPEEVLVEAFKEQVGEIMQRPSAVSAIKVAGRRAYDRVRSGEDVELPARPVTIHELEISRIRHVETYIDVDINVLCSSGTYIRAIARDVGHRTHLGGHLTSLRRTSSGAFGIEESTALQAIVDAGADAKEWLLDSRTVAMRSLPWSEVDAATAQAIRYGQPLPWPDAVDKVAPHAFVDDASLLAIGEPKADRLHYLAVFSE